MTSRGYGDILSVSNPELSDDFNLRRRNVSTTENHTFPCALIVYQKPSHRDETYIEDDDYSIHYTITSAPFRKLFFTSVQMGADVCKLTEICGSDEPLRTGQTIERELTVESSGKEKWRFETEIFSNGYKVFQFLRRPRSETSKQSR
jgi:hypothetical protein